MTTSKVFDIHNPITLCLEVESLWSSRKIRIKFNIKHRSNLYPAPCWSCSENTYCICFHFKGNLKQSLVINLQQAIQRWVPYPTIMKLSADHYDILKIMKDHTQFKISTLVMCSNTLCDCNDSWVYNIISLMQDELCGSFIFSPNNVL